MNKWIPISVRPTDREANKYGGCHCFLTDGTGIGFAELRPYGDEWIFHIIDNGYMWRPATHWMIPEAPDSPVSLWTRIVGWFKA